MNDLPEENKTAFERWELPTLNEESSARSVKAWDMARVNQLPTAQELEQIRMSAYEEGLQQGQQEGLKRGTQEIKAAVTRFAQAARALVQPIEAQDAELEQAMLEMTLNICKKILKRELSINSESVLQIVQEAIELVSPDAKRHTLYLSAADYELVNQYRDEIKGLDPSWKIKAHPTLSPGGCVVETHASLVDATIDQRINQILSAVYKAAGDQKQPQALSQDPLTQISDYLSDDPSD